MLLLWNLVLRHSRKLLFVLCLTAASVKAETRDGFWWVRQSDTDKIYYVLGAIDRTMLTGSINDKLKREVVGTPQMSRVVSELDRIYSVPASRRMLVQMALPMALYEIAQSAPK